MQRCAAHFVMNNYFQISSISNMLLHLNWNSLETHCKFLRLQMLHKIIHTHVDITLPSYVTYRSRYTRSKHFKFIKIGSTVDAYKYSFFPSMIRLWNTLPENIIICKNVDTLKDLLCQITL